MINAVVALLVIAQAPQADFPWETKWHGQRLAVNLISRGEALKGKHFEGKYNRLAEHPWNEVQTLLGTYMITRLDEYAKKVGDPQIVEALAIETCGSIMTMLSTHQQLYEGHVVYQLDDWRASDQKWKQVWRAPNLARSILRLTPSEAQEMAKVCGLQKKVALVPQYRAYSPDDQESNEVLEFKRKLSSRELLKLIGKSTAILSKEKNAEVSAILSRFEECTAKAKLGS